MPPTIPETPAATRCVVCTVPLAGYPDDVPPLCEYCTQRLPPSLVKAGYDPFHYALKLRTGEVIRFSGATITGEYATLDLNQVTDLGDEAPNRDLRYPFPRGLDVRISDIVWCADAPWGS